MPKNTQNDTSSLNEENSQATTYERIKNKSESTSSNHSIHFLTDENFNKLRQFQNEIYQLYEVSPSIRKIVNSLITNENLNQLKEQFMKQLNV